FFGLFTWDKPFFYNLLVFFDKINHIRQTFCKLLKIFLVEKNFMFDKLAIFKSSLTFRDCHIVIIRSRGFDIKKISSSSCPYPFRKYFFTPIVFKISHYSSNMLKLKYILILGVNI